MSRKRDHISHETELAAALLMYRAADGKPWIPYEHAKLMTPDQVISLFQRQHNILHSHDGPDTHWNIEWMPIMLHREVTAKIDIPRAAKTKRLAKARAALDLFLATGEKPPVPKRASRKILSRPDPWPPKGSRKLQSRGFSKRPSPPALNEGIA